MKNSLSLVAYLALLAGVAPAFGAPKSKPKTPAKAPAKAPIKTAADSLEIPAFAPIPDEFVFAGTQKDVYKLLEKYTGGVSLEKIPEPTDAERKEMIEKTGSAGNETLQALLDVKHILAPLHVIHVRSISYYALGEEGRDKAVEKLTPKTQAASKKGVEGSIESGITNLGDFAVNRGDDPEDELLKDAETFYKNLMVKQGGKVQTIKNGETSITVYAFAQPQTFAVITRGPSRVIVARADGKPDIGAILGIFQQVVDGG